MNRERTVRNYMPLFFCSQFRCHLPRPFAFVLSARFGAVWGGASLLHPRAGPARVTGWNVLLEPDSPAVILQSHRAGSLVVQQVVSRTARRPSRVHTNSYA